MTVTDKKVVNVTQVQIEELLAKGQIEVGDVRLVTAGGAPEKHYEPPKPEQPVVKR
jgi:hypothetical protein